jgi:hypothetical protein
MDVATIVQIEEQQRMHESIPDNSAVTGLYWLAFILTGCQEISVSVTAEVLSMETGNEATCYPSNCHLPEIARLRRAVVTRSVAAKESELRWARDRYKRQTDCGFGSEPGAGLDAMPDFFQVRNALLAIDLFTRHALLLTVFEGFSVRDAARCLHSNEQSICDACRDGLMSLARNVTPVPAL